MYKGKDYKYAVRAAILMGILIRLLYVLYTPYTVGQHDTGFIGDEGGHIPYIEYCLRGEPVFHQFDSRLRTQFYHPPLHHLASALFVKGNLALGVEYEQAFENLQLLTCVYSIVTLFLCYQIFKELGLTGKGFLLANMMVCFHPMLFMLAGSLNNDALCLMFSLGAVLYVIRWHKVHRTGTILASAVCILGAVLTKATGFMIAPAVAVLFLADLWKAWKEKKGLPVFGQLALFGAVCIPAGLSWSIYNWVRFGIPFTYIPASEPDRGYMRQYIGDHSVFQRLFCFAPAEIKELHVVYNGYSVPVNALKTAMFGEYQFPTHNAVFLAFAVLCATALLAFVLGVIVFVITAKRVHRKGMGGLFLLEGISATFLASYINFCFAYPYVCSMNFRYLAIVIPAFGACFGFGVSELNDEKRPEKLLGQSFWLMTLCWCAVSCVCYLMFGFSSRDYGLDLP